ncbi:uncharacterized protein LOC143448312 [Clavelina lepadiformis]|uniref:uncharacterized protein LOC143448312 n=1 Tax=Clavelina lepadiformis TaxID=159417 RepID=UPI0040426877
MSIDTLVCTISRYCCKVHKMKELKSITNILLVLPTFCLVLLVETAVAASIQRDWICEASAPCIRVLRPLGGAGEVKSDIHEYTLEVSVHRRQNDARIQKWFAAQSQTTWNVVINWYRLLETSVRVPLSSCRNNLECLVSVHDVDDVVYDDQSTTPHKFIVKHFAVEVRFEGHQASSKVEIVIRKELPPLDDNASDLPKQLSIIDALEKAGLSKDQMDVIGASGSQKGIDLQSETPQDDVDNVILEPDTDEPTGWDDDEPEWPDGSQDGDDYARQPDLSLIDPGSSDFLKDEDFYRDFDDWSWYGISDKDYENGNATLLDHITGLFDKSAEKLGKGTVVTLIVVGIILMVLILTCCCIQIKKRNYKRQKEQFGRSRTVKTAPERSIWRRIAIWFRFLKTKNPGPYILVPSSGPFKKKKRKKSKVSNRDGFSDEEVGMSPDEPSKPPESVNSALDFAKLKAEALSKSANRVFVTARRRSVGFTDKTREYAKKAGKGILGCILAFIKRCCPGRAAAGDGYEPLLAEEGGLDHGRGFGSNVVAPSTGVVPKSDFTPKTDISGRFLVKSQKNEGLTLDQRDDYVASTPRHGDQNVNPLPSATKVITAALHTPHGNCGLHCLQSENPRGRNDAHNTPTTSETSSVTSGEPTTSTTSMTSIESDFPPAECARDLSFGDAPCSSGSRPLPGVIRRTKESFRRENQRMEALLKRWEKRTASCVVINETLSRSRKRAGRRLSKDDDRRKRAGRYLKVENKNSEIFSPGRVIVGRRRTNRSLPVQENALKKEAAPTWHTRPSNTSTTSSIKLGSAPKLRQHFTSKNETQNFLTDNARLPQVDDVNSKSTSSDKYGTSSDENTYYKIAPLGARTNTNQSKQATSSTRRVDGNTSRVNDVRTHSKASPMLQSVVDAFMASDNDIPSCDDDYDDDFWNPPKK